MKNKTVLDAIYNGAWNNLELSQGSKKSLYTAGGIVLVGLFVAVNIYKKNGKL